MKDQNPDVTPLLPPVRRGAKLSDDKVVAGVIASLIQEGYTDEEATRKLIVHGARYLLARRRHDQNASKTHAARKARSKKGK